MICLICEVGELRPSEGTPLRCDTCGCAVESDVQRTLKQIASLPEALGKHACDCGHPEMRLLPDEVFHCPACGVEVIPPRSRLWKDTS